MTGSTTRTQLLINLQGPYVHGHWKGTDSEIRTNDTWVSRSEEIVVQIEKELRKHHSTQQLSKMTLLDVGCYDGWITNELQNRLGFQEAIGVEPRKKNIAKGLIARKTLKIDTDCTFLEGSFEEIGNLFGTRKFDVVVCVGVFHHLYDHLEAMSRLRERCSESGICFVETICLPDLGTKTESLVRRMIELKDDAYRNREPIFGITAYKIESGYSDGSTHLSGLVGIPSVGQLELISFASGFSKPRYLLSNNEYSNRVSLGHRSFSALLCCMEPLADRESLLLSIKESCFQSELLHCGTVLPNKWLTRLSKAFGQNTHGPGMYRKLLVFAIVTLFGNGKLSRLGHSKSKDRLTLQREILNSVNFCPEDRTLIEVAKSQMAGGEIDVAINSLGRLTKRDNADWRCTYRACILMAICFDILGDPIQAQEYREFALLGQPNLDERLLRPGDENPIWRLLCSISEADLPK